MCKKSSKSYSQTAMLLLHIFREDSGKILTIVGRYCIELPLLKEGKLGRSGLSYPGIQRTTKARCNSAGGVFA